MKRRMMLLTSLLFCAYLTQPAFALTLPEAKEQGSVGEQRDGYLGLVTASVSAEVRAMVESVNNQRRERYQQIAQQNGIEVRQVAALAYGKAVEATQPGHFIQDSGGAWVRK
ncbi:MAG: hypothetical protein ACI95C_002206 [Pseudohongiellaceae bacterium]|jgi:uncharacterized protein YdbL (DUF1318 family)